jgi:hypothetical protein
MSELPPTIDAILESIRARVAGGATGELPPPFAAPAPPPPPEKPVLVEEIGAIRISGAGKTVDELIEAMLEPMLKAWLDDNLPEIVERVARTEIRRIAGE